MATFEPNEIEDEMVRDFTEVRPRSKSEVRKRINDYAVKSYHAGFEAGRDKTTNIQGPIVKVDYQGV